MPTYTRPTYHRTAKFSGKPESDMAFSQIQEIIIKSPEYGLSVHRFSMCGDWHVAVLGNPHNKELSERLEEPLRDGERVNLSIHGLDFLVPPTKVES